LINSTNATTSTTNIFSNNSNPTNNNSWINLSVAFNDANDDEWTAYFCKTNAFNGNACTGGEFCHTEVNSTNYPVVSCNYSVSPEINSNVSYYVYVIDNTSLYQGDGSGFKWSFIVNHPPTKPTLLSPLNDTWSNLNSTLLNFTTTDSDLDIINYYVYLEDNSSPDTLVNITSNKYFNMTGLNETRYYWKVIANDTHGYSSESSITKTINVDYTKPQISNITLSSTSIYTDELMTIFMDCYDSNSGADTGGASYNLTDALLSLSTQSLSHFINNTYYDIYVPLGVAGTYYLDIFKCYDLAGNMATYNSNDTFSVSIRPTEVAGGSNPFIPQATIDDDTNENENRFNAVCGNGICEEGEFPSTCVVDCPINFDRLITCIWDPNINCLYSESWFVTILFFILIAGGIYLTVVSNNKKFKIKW